MRRAAVFDVDGTILKGSSERIFIRYLLQRGELGPGRLISTLPASLRWRPLRALKRNKLYLRDMEVERTRRLALQCLEEKIIPLISPRIEEAIESHRLKGDLVVVLTGSLDILAGPLATHLRADLWVATRMENGDGCFTGRIDGIHPYGRDKLRALKGIAEERGIDLERSYAYGNSFGDREVLSAVGYPVAVNPDPLLWLLAKKRGWKILYT